MEKGEFRFEIIRSGKRFLKLDTKMLRDFINGFVAEDAFLIHDKKVSLAEELAWQKATAKDIENGKVIMLHCWKGKSLIGNSMLRHESGKQSHNAHFGLVVKKGFRSMGIGEKLLSMAMREAKSALKAKNLWIEFFEGNAPARALYEKFGFREVARLKNYVRHKGAYRDKILMRHSKNI